MPRTNSKQNQSLPHITVAPIRLTPVDMAQLTRIRDTKATWIGRNEARLVSLGLVEHREVKPTVEEIAEYDKQVRLCLEKTLKLAKANDFYGLVTLYSGNDRLHLKPRPVKRYVLTPLGETVLESWLQKRTFKLSR